MTRVMILLLLAALPLSAQTNSPATPEGYKMISEITKADGSYLGTLIGKPVGAYLYSTILIVRLRGATLDTLFRFYNDHTNPRYQGCGVHVLSHDSIGVWYESPVSASDEEDFYWDDSLKTYKVVDYGY